MGCSGTSCGWRRADPEEPLACGCTAPADGAQMNWKMACTLQCYFQMINVAALYFPCKCLNPILGLETCGSGVFPYKKSCFHTDKGVQPEILQNIDTEKHFFLKKKKKKASNVTNPSTGNLAKKKSFLLVNIDRFLLPNLISSQEGQKSFSWNFKKLGKKYKVYKFLSMLLLILPSLLETHWTWNLSGLKTNQVTF